MPARIRQALDVESGLNDGVSLPFVIIFAGLAAESTTVGAFETFIREIGVAVVVGLVVGIAGGWLLDRAAKAAWMGAAWSSIAVIAIHQVQVGVIALQGFRIVVERINIGINGGLSSLENVTSHGDGIVDDNIV